MTQVETPSRKAARISDEMVHAEGDLVRAFLGAIGSRSSEMFAVVDDREPMIQMPYNRLQEQVWALAERLVKRVEERAALAKKP